MFVGNKEIREWVEEQEVFTRSVEAGEEIIFALEELLSKKGSFDGGTASRDRRGYSSMGSIGRECVSYRE
jgi:hypothetical protein